MTAQQIFEKTEELVQAVKDQPTEVLVDMYKDGGCASEEANDILGDMVMDELRRRYPDRYDKWFNSVLMSVDCFLD